VSGLASGVVALAAGDDHTCALMASGGAKCWGSNDAGQLGDGTATTRLTPVEVSSLASAVTTLAAGAIHTCAVTAGGAMCWGDNDYGQLGNGTTISRSTPVDVSGLASGVAALAAGGFHTCAETSGGGVKCWGANQFGQVGDGTTTTRLTPVDVFLPVVCYLPAIFRNYCSGCCDFFDDFSNPASGWYVGEDSLLRAEYLNGEYRVVVKPEGYLFLFRAPTCDRENYIVEADARWYGATGNSYGLLFGLTSGFSRYYLFDMNTDYKQFRVYRREASGFVAVVPATSSSAIQGGTASNHLKVTRSDGQFTLEINGTVLGSWSDSAITGLTGVGLAVSSYSNRPNADARFDNFRVARYASSMSVTTADLDATAGTAQPNEDDAFSAPMPEELYWQVERQESGPQSR
jgi:hypothetical protein